MSERSQFSGNSYLTLAYKAISIARRPLTPTEILDVARDNNLIPDHLFGATMHRTLNARLSEHIRYKNDKSAFFRTAPSKFFLHDIANDRGIPDEFRRVYIGHLRSKSIRKENVLVAPKVELSRNIYGDYVPYDEKQFETMYRSICRFSDRSLAEDSDDIKQFVTFTLVLHKNLLLTYRRGKFTTTSDRLKGQMSVGFGGHVNDSDFTLFNRGGDAFRANAARELREELFLDEIYSETGDAMDRSKILGYVNVDDSPDAQHHIAVLIAFHHQTSDLPKKGELSINQLSWMDLTKPKNDLSDFDLWSGMILRNIYQGRIRVN